MSDPKTHIESALQHLRSMSSPPAEVRSAIAELDAALQGPTASPAGTPPAGNAVRHGSEGQQATGVSSGQAGQAELAEVKNPWETA